MMVLQCKITPGKIASRASTRSFKGVGLSNSEKVIVVAFILV
jgi:hypothetical protein